MRITQISNNTVTYQDHVERFKGFMTTERKEQLYTRELPINVDSHAVIELHVRSIINGLDAVVTYKQLIVDENGSHTSRVLLQYPYTVDLDGTQTMITAAASEMNITATHLQALRQVLPALMMQDMINNNVYGLTAADWTTHVE